ncbi:MAG: hypothetical protein ACRCYQ_04225, partial [Nocardioides sp.]
MPAGLITSTTEAQALTYYSTIGTGPYEAPTRLREASGQAYVHPNNYSFRYNESFHTICNAWADTYGSIMRWMTGGAVGTTWFGCIGTYANKPGSHGTGDA